MTRILNTCYRYAVEVLAGLTLIFAQPVLVSAACGPAMELLYNTHFKGQKCQSGAEITRTGGFRSLSSGEKLKGTVHGVFLASDKMTVTQGEVSGPFQGLLMASTEAHSNNQYPKLRHEEGRSGTEDLGNGERFDGETHLLRYEDDAFTEKHGVVTSPTKNQLVVTTTETHPSNASPQLRHEEGRSGTEDLGNGERFEGDTHLLRYDGDIFTEKHGVVTSPTKNQLVLTTTETHPSNASPQLRHEEGRSGTEDLGNGERFEGDTHLLRYDGDHSIQKLGYLLSPTVQAIMKSTVESQGSDVRSEVNLDGVWKIGTKKFKGTLTIFRDKDLVKVVDKRLPI